MRLLFILSLFCLFTSFTSNPWELAKTQNNVSVYTRTKQGSLLKEFKAVTQCKCNKKDLEHILKDLENMPTWSDMISHVEILKVVSSNEAIYKLLFDFPLADDRYSTMIASIYYNKNKDLIVDTEHYPYTHTPVPNTVFVNHIMSRWIISGQDQNLTVEYYGFMDPAGKIPEWIINKSITSAPINTLRNLKAIVEKK